MGRAVYVFSFKGIPEVAFYSGKDLAAYLRKEGTSLEEVREDMEANPMAEWEVHTIDVE